MSEKDRDKIKVLIEHSLAADNATIDWKKLRQNIQDYALQQAQYNPHYQEALLNTKSQHPDSSKPTLSLLEAPYINAMDRAKAEVLNVIQEDHWDKPFLQDTGYKMLNWLKNNKPNPAIAKFDAEKFVCNQPHHTPGHIDPSTSFDDQKVICKATNKTSPQR